MRKTTVRRGLAAGSAFLSALAVTLVAPTPAQAQRDRSCDSYQSREVRRGYLRVPSRDGGELRCRLERGDRGPGVRVLKFALNQCYRADLSPNGRFDGETERALRRVQRRIGDEGPAGVYTGRTRRAGFEFTVFERRGGWDPTGRCQSWRGGRW
jgi:hypothetical protein